MNIFGDIKEFFGEYKKGEYKRLSSNFWSKMRELRKKLGKYAYILDSHLYSVFSIIEKLYVDDIVNDVDSLVGEIESVCRSICRDNYDYKINHWFYETAKNYIKEHPLRYKDYNTRAYIYMVCLFDDFTDIYFEKKFNKLDVKYHNICNSNNTIKIWMKYRITYHTTKSKV